MNMNPSSSKTSLSDLSASVQELNKKFFIDQFKEEAEKVLKNIDYSTEIFNSMIMDPMAIMQPEDPTTKPQKDEKIVRKCISEYNGLKKKYNYDMYLKEGVALRKKFLKERKSYLFNTIKIMDAEYPAGRQTNAEKLSYDFAQQHFIAQFLDKTLRKINPTSLTMSYEDINGEIKTVRVSHKKVDLNPDYIEAPLIDRIIGGSLFDSFLIHSFYNIDEKKWQYVPVKFIINIESK